MCKICRDLRSFHGVKFGLKDLLCVKDMTFRNSGDGDGERATGGARQGGQEAPATEPFPRICKIRELKDHVGRGTSKHNIFEPPPSAVSLFHR